VLFQYIQIVDVACYLLLVCKQMTKLEIRVSYEDEADLHNKILVILVAQRMVKDYLSYKKQNPIGLENFAEEWFKIVGTILSAQEKVLPVFVNMIRGINSDLYATLEEENFTITLLLLKV